ncbi:hypothetical protein NBRC116494_30960 [Aurantivibrio plasticivorans]
MENWLKRVLLITLASSSLISLSPAMAQGADDDLEESNGNATLEKIITPDLERREIEEDILDNEDFEIGIYTGFLTVEDFGTNSVTGIRIAYHVTEDFFMEGSYAFSELGESSIERFAGSLPLFPDTDRDLNYYNISFGWNVLPGEAFLSENWAFNSAIYLVGGAGSTSFGDEQYFTASLGGGLRLALTDWLAMHFDTRIYRFTHDLFGEEVTTLNPETTLGFTIFF